jgi:predicted O-methyltransferase YrrM
MLGPSSVGELALKAESLEKSIEILKRMEPDAYVDYLMEYYSVGLKRFGDAWRYADIVTVLGASAQLLTPRTYLEIGVRRGRSMGIVAALCPDCDLVGFDLWVADYAGMANPGPDFVSREMQRVGHRGKLQLISGDSHVTVPRYIEQHPDRYFDLVTVDGDHSRKGARQDLLTVIPRINLGGILVFDDLCHPAHPYLRDVWQGVVGTDDRFATWDFTELGYGVAVAVRKS